MNSPLLLADYNGDFFPMFVGFPTAIAAIIFLFIAADRAILRRSGEAKIPAIIALGLFGLTAVIFYFGKKYGP